MRFLSLGVLMCGFSVGLAADDMKPLFNGKDLTGWEYVNTPKSTFYVKDKEIITTGTPTGFLRTDKQYENFVLEFDWMHVEKTKMANSGLFVWGDPIPAIGSGYTRGIEVQVLINYAPKDGWATSHGDIFSIWGAKCVPDRPHPKGLERCLPSENRVKGGGEWNHYKVTGNDGIIKLEVNGKEVSGVSKCTPRKGYLALESEGVECHFKNIMIKELPSTNPKPSEIADEAKGEKMLFNGQDLDGWELYQPPGIDADKEWKAGGGRIIAGGKNFLTTKEKYAQFELLFDWKIPAESDNTEMIISAGGKMHTVKLADDAKRGGYHRAKLKFDGPSAPIQFLPRPGLELMNLYVRELK